MHCTQCGKPCDIHWHLCTECDDAEREVQEALISEHVRSAAYVLGGGAMVNQPTTQEWEIWGWVGSPLLIDEPLHYEIP